ncbi:MAG: DNA primase [Treponema sp.]
MPRFISQETIKAAENADIVNIIDDYTKLEMRGANDWWGCCPFHGEKTASFHVDADKKFYYCFGCHVGGNVINFIKEQEKLSYYDAVEFVAKKAGIPISYADGAAEKSDPKLKLINDYLELYDRCASMFHYILTETEQGKNALDYITGRGISVETVKKFNIGYAPADKRWLKRFLLKKNFSQDFLNQSGLFSKKYSDVSFFTHRLMFPIYNRHGKVAAFGGRALDNAPNNPKYLNSGDSIQYKKGETLYAFNFAKKAVKEAKKVIFCEGYMDCITYHQCGIEYAVAPLGTALTDEQIKIVRPFVDEVLLSFDADEAGQKATERAIYMLRRHSIVVKVIQLSGGKDPAEIMNNYGAEVLTNEVGNAILDSNFLISRLGEKYPLDTPDGKTKASLEYFSYVDSLQSDIQKESCLEQLCQTFNLKPEAVKRDFYNREQARNRLNIRQPDKQEALQSIKPTAELRSVLAIIADLNKYKTIRNELTPDDFEDPHAIALLNILEKCYSEDALSLNAILDFCDDERLANLITKVISLGEFKDYSESAVQDSIRLIKKKVTERRRDKIMERIRGFHAVTAEDKDELNALLAEKMNLDRQLKN